MIGKGGPAHHPILGGVLSPVDRTIEVFCGLLMVLAVTLLVGHDVVAGREGVHALLRAALGGNLAWGIIDGVLYLMSQRYERGRQARLVAAVRDARDEGAIRNALDHVLNRGLVIAGEITISVADIDLIFVGLNILVSSVETANEVVRNRK